MHYPALQLMLEHTRLQHVPSDWPLRGNKGTFKSMVVGWLLVVSC